MINAITSMAIKFLYSDGLQYLSFSRKDWRSRIGEW